MVAADRGSPQPREDETIGRRIKAGTGLTLGAALAVPAAAQAVDFRVRGPAGNDVIVGLSG
ncbi:MAG TPA: hypothetical protein VHJ54_03990 [Solirubrobacterales bacterium]|jgi:hypothetical protein|nr:hypothetical protein [Solirubrobacterales bacterium]